MLWLLLLKPSVCVFLFIIIIFLLQVLKYDNIELNGTPSSTGELTSYLRMYAKHMYLQEKGGEVGVAQVAQANNISISYKVKYLSTINNIYNRVQI